MIKLFFIKYSSIHGRGSMFFEANGHLSLATVKLLQKKLDSQIDANVTIENIQLVDTYKKGE